MTSVTITTNKNTVTVDEDNPSVITVATQGPQGVAFADGDAGDITVSNSGTTLTIDAGVVNNAKIASDAAIALSKLATGALPTGITVASANIPDLTIVNSDISASAAIALSKLATGPLPTGITVASANIPDLTIVNADISASAAIAGTKISPDFGSQDITTTGEINGKDLILTDTHPSITFTDSDHNPDYKIKVNNGMFEIVDTTNNVDTFQINSDGHIDIAVNLDCEAGLDVTGNITVTGTVDGVDIATRDTLFGGLTSSSGVLSNGVTATTQSASDNSTKVATTAYTETAISNLVDSSPSALNTLNELAEALGDDANFSTTVTNSIATKLPLAGGTLTGSLTLSSEAPNLLFTESDANPDFGILLNGGQLKFQDTTNTANILTLDDDKIQAVKNLDALAGVDVTGNITATGHLDLPDGSYIKLGDSDEFIIRHTDAGASEIKETGGGHLNIKGDHIVLKGADNVDKLRTTASGIDIYYDGSKKLETTSDGILVDGDATFVGVNYNIFWDKSDNALKFTDNSKLWFGDHSGTGDLHIYHSGSESNIVDAGTGVLRIGTSQLNITNAALSETLAKFIADSYCELDYDNSPKLKTESNGVQIFDHLGVGTASVSSAVVHVKTPEGSDGNQTTEKGLVVQEAAYSSGDILDVQGSVANSLFRVSGATNNVEIPTDNTKLTLGADADLEIFHTGTEALIDNDTGWLNINTATGGIQINKGTAEYMGRFLVDGSCELYYDNSPKLVTKSAGVFVDGKALIGNSSSLAISWIEARTQVVGTGFNDSSLSLSRFSEGGAPALVMSQSRNGTVGQHGALLQNDSVGSLFFFGSDGNSFEEVAAIKVEIDGAPGNGDMPGRIMFLTTPDGASSATEKMRVRNDRVTVTTTNAANGLKNITTSTSAPSGGSDGDLWFTYT